MRVLVTGGSSLLARGAVERLLTRGDDVVLLQRHRAVLDVEQVLGDVRDETVVARALEGCDAAIHCAAKVGVVGTWSEYRDVNVVGTANVLAAARRHSIAGLVHVSTPSVAHAGSSLVGVGATPAVTGRRGAYYAESKAAAEQMVLSASDDTLPIVTIRPHLVWGPGDTQLVGRIIERARAGRLLLVGRGAALIDSTYIDNAASALVAALDAAVAGSRAAGRAYVIANGEPRPVAELLAGICRAAGVDTVSRRVPRSVALAAGSAVECLWSFRRNAGEPPLTRFLAEQLGTAHWFDPRPAHDDLGWSPTVSLDEGLVQLAAWFAAHPVGAP